MGSVPALSPRQTSGYIPMTHSLARRGAQTRIPSQFSAASPTWWQLRGGLGFPRLAAESLGNAWWEA